MGIGEEKRLMHLKIARIDGTRFAGTRGEFRKVTLAIGTQGHSEYPFAIGRERRSSTVAQANRRRPVSRSHIKSTGFAAGFTCFVERDELTVIA